MIIELDTNDIRWEMKYHSGEIEQCFETELAVAHLLIAEQLFLNNYWWKEKEWPADACAVPSLNLNCSDVFMWGSADAENVKYTDIKSIYEHFEKDSKWGTAVWCIKHRKQRPQQPVYDAIQEEGIWNLDTIIEEWTKND